MISAVWLVRSHQIAADLRYWLTYIGYDRRDHSLSHKIYLGYATLFFTAWLFATLTLMAGWVGILLSIFGGASGTLANETQTAVGILTLALLGWWIYAAVRAGRFSPITFNEDDSALICMTPVSRPAVALLWQLGDWIKVAPAFLAIGVTLAFALQDRALGAAVSVEYVPRYVLAGLKLLAVVIPLQWGLMAFVYAWGVLRLQRDRVRRFWWLYPGLLGLLLVMLLAARFSDGLFTQVALLPVFQPLAFSIRGGYGLVNWPLAWIVGLIWAGFGTLALALAARPLNLSRAAQESTLRSAIEIAAQSGNMRAASEISLRRRLGAGHTPTRLAGRPGWLALVWKTGLVWNRRGFLALFGSCLLIFATGLAVALAPDWGSRIWALFAWLITVQQFTAAPLTDDLRLWAIFRGLPISGRQVIIGELVLPSIFVAVLGWISLAAAEPLHVFLPAGGLPGWAAFLVPGAAFSCALAAALDVLRNCRSGRLMTGQAPMPGTTGMVIAGLITGAGALTVQFVGDNALGYLYGGVILGWIGYILLNFVVDTLRRVE